MKKSSTIAGDIVIQRAPYGQTDAAVRFAGPEAATSAMRNSQPGNVFSPQVVAVWREHRLRGFIF